MLNLILEYLKHNNNKIIKKSMPQYGLDYLRKDE